MCRLQRLVVQEPIEILVDVVSHNVFLAFCADLFGERVVREEVDETVGAVVSVVRVVSCWTRDTVFIRGTPFVLDIHHVFCCVCLAVQCLCLTVDIVVWAFVAIGMCTSISKLCTFSALFLPLVYIALPFHSFLFGGCLGEKEFEADWQSGCVCFWWLAFRSFAHDIIPCSANYKNGDVGGRCTFFIHK